MQETAQENQKKQGVSYYLKTGLLVTLLALISFYLTKEIVIYISIGEFFAPQFTSFIKIFLGMVSLLYVYALTIGAWNKWEQYVIVPAPIAVGAMIEVYFINPAYSLTIGLALFVLVSYDVMLATKVKDQLIKFNPRLIFKLSAKGMLFSYALIGALLLMAHTNAGDDFNIAPKLGKLVSEQVHRIIEPQIGDIPTTENIIDYFQESSISEDLGVDLNDPSVRQNLENIDSQEVVGNLMQNASNEATSAVENTITNEVNRVIAPYRSFIKPLMAVFIFGVLEFIGLFAGIFFIITVPIVFWLGKKIKFYNIEQRPVQQEILTFDE